MRGTHQLAASGDAAPLGPAASAVASVTCLAVNALFRAMQQTSCPPETPLKAFVRASMRDVLVRTSVL